MLTTTNDFIKLLRQCDPAGSLVLMFRIEAECEEVIAGGEVYPDDIGMVLEYRQPTVNGDVDVLKITLKLECNKGG